MSTLLSSVFESLRKRDLRLMPQTRHADPHWMEKVARWGLDDPTLPRFHLDHAAASQIEKIMASITPDEWTKIVRQTRLPFKKFWVELSCRIPFDEAAREAKSDHIYGFLVQSGRGANTAAESVDIFYTSFWVGRRYPDGRTICGVSASGFIFRESSLAYVENGKAFLSGLDVSQASSFGLDNQLLRITPADVKKMESADFDALEAKEEIAAGTLAGIGMSTMMLNALRKELFIFIWLLSARLIKTTHTFSAPVKIRTKTRGTIHKDLQVQATKIDLLRVKEINSTLPREPAGSGPCRAEHAVMGHFATSKRGKRFWRKPHNRGKLPPNKPTNYSVQGSPAS